MFELFAVHEGFGFAFLVWCGVVARAAARQFWRYLQERPVCAHPITSISAKSHTTQCGAKYQIEAFGKLALLLHFPDRRRPRGTIL